MHETSSPLRGIILLLAAFFILSIQDVIVKLMSDDLALLQIVFFRTLFTLPMVYLMLHFNGGLKTLKTADLSLQLIRGLAMFLAYIFFFMALSALPFSLNQALFFSGPLFITALSVPLLKEHVGWPRWLAVLIGFFGVIVAINPSNTHFDPATLLSLAAALAYATSIIYTRKLNDTPQAITAYTTGVYMLGALILSPIFAGMNTNSVHPSIEFLTKSWPTLAPRDIFFIFLIALIWSAGMLMLSSAYRDNDVAILAPFEYFSIVYGLLFGFLFWQEIPTAQMLIGLVFIVGSGLFIIYRENRARA